MNPAYIPVQTDVQAAQTTRFGFASFIIAVASAALYLMVNTVTFLAQTDLDVGFGLLSFFGTADYLIAPGVLAVVFGHLGSAREKRQGGRTRRTLTGLIVGYILSSIGILSIVLSVLVLLLVVAFFHGLTGI